MLATDLSGVASIGGAALVALTRGLSLSIHSLSLAYTNDYLDAAELVGASSGLVLLLGAGSVCGPNLAGVALRLLGPPGFFFWPALSYACLGLFAIWRITQREAMPTEEQAPYVPAPLQGTEVLTAVAEAAAREEELGERRAHA